MSKYLMHCSFLIRKYFSKRILSHQSIAVKVPLRFALADKASSYNRSWADKVLTIFYELITPGLSLGSNSVVKSGVEFALTDGASISIGKFCTIKENSYFLLTKPSPKLIVGDYSGIGRNCYIAIKDTLVIGNCTRIGPNVCILDQNHGTQKDSLVMNQPADIKAVSIGSDVWIGTHVTILPGVTIGDGAIVGAGAVVTKNIPPYQIWAGVPAKKLRDRI